MPREFKVRFALSVGLTLLVLIALGAAIIYAQNDLSTVSGQLAGINQGVVNKTIQLKNLADLQNESSSTQPLIANMVAAVPSEDNLYSVQQNLESIAKNDNLAFSSEFGGENQPGNGTPGNVQIEILLQGNYSDIISFLSSVETTSGFISVSSIDLTAQPAGGEFNATIDGDVPFSSSTPNGQ